MVVLASWLNTFDIDPNRVLPVCIHGLHLAEQSPKHLAGLLLFLPYRLAKSAEVVR